MRYPKLIKNLHYHIFNRAAANRLIFKQDKDYRYFMYKISQFKKKYEIEILVYCIMPNHFHLSLRSDHDPKNISKFLKALQQSYAIYFNREYGNKGHVFESRFTHKPIETNISLARVKRYILNNPVRKGLVKKYYEWPYCWINPYL
ncbi:transposase [Patescibacteria group bacterium]